MRGKRFILLIADRIAIDKVNFTCEEECKTHHVHGITTKPHTQVLSGIRKNLEIENVVRVDNGLMVHTLVASDWLMFPVSPLIGLLWPAEATLTAVLCACVETENTRGYRGY